MGFRHANDPEDITNQYAAANEEAVPLTISVNRRDEKRDWLDEVSPELEPYLNTPPTQGLTDEQVAERLARFGRNELPDIKRNKLLHFLSFFNGAIAYLMEISIILTAITQDWIDFGIILGMLIINAVIGYVEEARADSAVAALKGSLALKTRCWRSNQLQQVPAADLVVGDILVLRLGDIVPADARLLGLAPTGEPTETELQVDQSALTGESLPVKKRAGDIVYSSCIVKQGHQLAIVIRTGPHSFIGRAASLMTVTTNAGNFQKVINYIGNFLIIASVALVAIIFIFDLVEQKLQTGTVTTEHVMEALNEMVVLTIAAIPVGLPTVMSVTMAIGAKQLAKRQVVVKRLTAVEELASVSILCSDKTGTLTLNELTFDEPHVVPPFTKKEILMYAFLASEIGTSDPIESAIRSAAERALPGISADQQVEGYSVKDFVPFNPVDKMSQATVHESSTGNVFRVAKGAPQVILQLVGGRSDMEELVESQAARGLRSLGVARTRPGTLDEWELLGMLSMIDPPRYDSAATISECSKYGITVKMMTGDQESIAKEVAGRLGMGQRILNAQYLVDTERSEAEVTEQCMMADGFACMIPEHKYKVVELLQNRGFYVAMTGDGVNDAAALKKANVGIAVHGSTDAARAASDIVLMAPGLSAIIDGIKTSRVIFQRLHSYALYRITSTIHFLLFFFIVTLAEEWKMPPVFLILISVLNDAATLIMAVDNVAISPRPDLWRLRLLICLSCILALLLAGFSFAHFYVFRDVLHATPEELNTIMYLHISSAPHFVIFSTRIDTFFWRKMPSWPFTAVVLGTQVVALILSVYGIFGQVPNVAPIGWPRALIILAISLGTFVVVDILKVITIQLWNRWTLAPSRSSTSVPTKKSSKSRAQIFMQNQEYRSRTGYDRAERRDSISSVQSY
ncbi:plasma-membrane proton-efflux P-type ATPase [Radiomyces spectabilis]|uniref:plasma-membrane proton-efflux P-type ATPase n=1 Tax=Radiomyces spectabilis TaxID=64574 RepID=UPI002220B228|nr:plasma-membrane proton-efflux P-type ATPase [Radiomyces spectabilis]KAI8365986.1 plasma-membrane proton-efflux P-type ATPase [Radiomyces spectabilis]